MTSHTGAVSQLSQHASGSPRLFEEDPSYPSLQFKQIHSSRPIYSARVSLGYRALCMREGEKLVWSWMGSHADYDKLVSGR